MSNKSIINTILERNNNLFGINTDNIINEVGTVKISDKYKNMNKYVLRIMNDEGRNMPHFHVVKGTSTICYISLNIPIYFDHGNGIDKPLKPKECDELYEFMKSSYRNNKTVYETLCEYWEGSNGSFSFPDEVPDYTKLDPNITSKTIDVDEYRRSGRVIYKK